MAAKLLHSLTEDNPDLQKQIGCMTGIFQIFDRHQVLTGRRLHHKRLLPGTSHLTNCRLEPDSNNDVYIRRTETELSANKNVNEKHRVSTESSRASFSSSCSSSVSSAECNRAVQAEGSSFDRNNYPENPSTMKQTITCPHLGRQSLDLRDVVKDSMYREARGLLAKTASKEEVVGRAIKHRDSPRPLRLSTSVDGSLGLGSKWKQNDLKESRRVVAKLGEAPWHFNEPGELPFETSSLASSRDAPRFSYDGRELNRLSFESRDTFKSRLSLDSREGLMRNSSYDSKPNYLEKNLQLQKRPPSVVAKLMGLEALPDSTDLSNVYPAEDRDVFSRSLHHLNRPMRMPNSPRSSMKDPTSPRWKTMNTAMKPISSSRVPIEPAPWKHSEGSRGFRKPAVKALEKTPNSFPSVYSEIEKRLKDLEFKHSGKDLRALKQILEAMQAKGLLETGQQGSQREYESKSTSGNQNRRNSKSNNVVAATRGPNSSTSFESPIVIMKPAKLVVDSGNAASNYALTDAKRGSINSRRTRDQNPKSIQKESASSSTDKRSNGKITTRSPSMRSQPLEKENSTSSVKSSGSVSPRLRQKKMDWEKRSRPPTPPSSDSNKPTRQSNKQQTESSSPGRKLKLKSPNIAPSDDRSSEVSCESRALSYPANETCLQSDSNMVLDSQLHVGISCIERSAEISGGQSSSTKYTVSDLTQNKSAQRLSEDGPLPELASASAEHPSPVSVLEVSIYGDDAPSPVKEIPNSPEGDCANKNGSDKWNQLSEDMIFNSMESGLTSEISRKKLQNIEHLVHKLRRLNSNHDESNTDYIASLCENTNPDHRYISEILLASGLLLRDLGSGLATFQLHPSGHPINPELFLVLEQTKSSTVKASHSKQDEGKFHRKLIFDAVNEILAGKLALAGASLEPWLKSKKLVKKTLSAQKLLKELCWEIEQLQVKKAKRILEDEGEDEDDTLKSTLWEDVMHRSENWTDFQNEISGVALHVERLIFKDLVNEIVTGGAANLRAKPARRRQLFAHQ